MTLYEINQKNLKNKIETTQRINCNNAKKLKPSIKIFKKTGSIKIINTNKASFNLFLSIAIKTGSTYNKINVTSFTDIFSISSSFNIQQILFQGTYF